MLLTASLLGVDDDAATLDFCCKVSVLVLAHLVVVYESIVVPNSDSELIGFFTIRQQVSVNGGEHKPIGPTKSFDGSGALVLGFRPCSLTTLL